MLNNSQSSGQSSSKNGDSIEQLQTYQQMKSQITEN